MQKSSSICCRRKLTGGFTRIVALISFHMESSSTRVTFIQFRVFILVLSFKGFKAQSIVDATAEEINPSREGQRGGGRTPPTAFPVSF